MKKLPILLVLALMMPFGLQAQIIKKRNKSAQTSQKPITDFDRERRMIPGETMGQKLESLLFWSVAEKQRRFPVMQFIYPSKEVKTGKHIFQLEPGDSIQPEWGDDSNLTAYMAENNIAGIVVLKDDKIRLEAYSENMKPDQVWTSFSVAKSISSMLLGIALKEGVIHSLDDSLGLYIPEFRGQDYGKVTVRQLLTMTSGIGWNEDYEDHNSDVAQMYLKPCQGKESHIISYMKNIKFVHSPGSYWNYSTGETDLLGILIQKASGKSLADYLSEKIWKPWGMETQAYWLADECSGENIGGSGLSATARDYARLGSVMLHRGKYGKIDLFSEEWLENATSILQRTNEEGGGYGYLWWRFPNGSYAAYGIFGQTIYVNPNLNLVIVQIAAWPQASSKGLSMKRAKFIKAVERALSSD